MISIIISSANEKMLEGIKANIALTIDVPYELIVFDNKKGQKGLCEIYNQGVNQAVFNLLCFMHEDILIESRGWGKTVASLFEADPQIGLIGVAGSKYKPLAPSGWNGAGFSTDYVNIIQHHKHTNKESEYYYRNPENEPLVEVASIDGVWFCTTKAIANEIKFDDQTFQRFHAYDIDFSLAVGRHYKVMVTFDVLVVHFSEGNYNVEWLNEILKLNEKWGHYLPISVGDITPDQQARIEKVTFKEFIRQCIEWRKPVGVPMRELFASKRYINKFPQLIASLLFYLVKAYLSPFGKGS